MDSYRTMLLCIITRLIRTTNAIYGYDCTDQMANITTISLTEIGDCEIKEPLLNITKPYAQLIQLNDFALTQILKCSVKVTRTITHCGMHSHTSRVQDGELSYYRDIAREECIAIQATGAFLTSATHIVGLQRNSTTQKSMTFAGEIDKEGQCKGTTYADPYGKWDDVVVAGWLEITLVDYYTEVHLESNKVRLRSGVSCTLSSTTCIDSDGGHAFWSPLPEDTCGKNKYSVLHTGTISKLYEEDQGRTLYTLEDDDITFALWKKGEHNICGYKFMRTEHPKLFIIEDANQNEFLHKNTVATANLDIFAYVNSKFLYVEKHIKGQLRRLYFDILKNKCELERKVLTNALAIASINPAEFGYRIMEERGYMGVVTGEVIHLLKCIKVDVVPRQTPHCYDQLPVFKGKQELFLAPRTRVLLRTGTQIYCDKRLPSMYKINEKWLRFVPDALTAETPEILKPQTKPTWKYNSPETLAIGGIYSEKDTSRLRDMILFPIEKPSVLNKIALSMTGRQPPGQGITLTNFFDERLLEHIAENTWRKFWANFLAFGNISAGFIGILMLCRLIKLLVDTFVHGYALYSLYGFSIHLIGSIWNSITQLLLHLGHMKQNKQRNETELIDISDNTENNDEPKRPTAPLKDETEKLYPELLTARRTG